MEENIIREILNNSKYLKNYEIVFERKFGRLFTTLNVNYYHDINLNPDLMLTLLKELRSLKIEDSHIIMNDK